MKQEAEPRHDRKISQRQVIANRQNGKLGGPNTKEGKDRVRWNALKHGLLTKSVVLKAGEFDEKEDDFSFLLSQLQTGLGPVGILEEMLVEKIAVSYWRLSRVLKAEGGLIGQSMIDMLDRKEDCRSRRVMLSKFSGSHVPLEKSLRRSVAGVAEIIELLGTALDSVNKSGFISKTLQSLLIQMFGKGEEDLGYELSVLNAFIKKHNSEGNDELEKIDNFPSREKCEQSMLTALTDARNHYVSSLSDVKDFEDMQNDISVSSLVVPTCDVSLRTLRYETAIERQLNRAMDQLERLQRSRAGEAVPPPVTVNLKTEA